tara:strand:+ start:1252 stop:1608 length:357 start_codon:yes stop_codon:yes gene_type:complete
MEIFILVCLLFLGFIPAKIARKKGRFLLVSLDGKWEGSSNEVHNKLYWIEHPRLDFFLWYFYGVMFFIIALIYTLFLKKDIDVLNKKKVMNGYMKECEFCGELIKPKAIFCIHCKKDL